MGSILDEEGRLFGRVNVIDAIVILAFIAMILGGAAVVNGGSGGVATADVTVESGVPPYVADAINDTRAPADENVVSVGAVRVIDDYRGEGPSGHNRTIQVVRFQATLETETSSDGLAFRGQRLYVGRSLTLDLNTTIVDADVVSIEGGEAVGD